MSRGALILAAISGAQFVLLLLIYSKTDAVQEDLQTSKAPASPGSLLHSGVRSKDQIGSGPGNESITERRLRQIIQEELRSQAKNAGLNNSQQETQPPAEQDVNDSVMASQRDFVLGQLDYYSSVGSISSADMAQLHMAIAKLDERGRREMMSRLNRALNSGTLKADL